MDQKFSRYTQKLKKKPIILEKVFATKVKVSRSLVKTCSCFVFWLVALLVHNSYKSTIFSSRNGHYTSFLATKINFNFVEQRKLIFNFLNNDKRCHGNFILLHVK